MMSTNNEILSRLMMLAKIRHFDTREGLGAWLKHVCNALSFSADYHAPFSAVARALAASQTNDEAYWNNLRRGQDILDSAIEDLRLQIQLAKRSERRLNRQPRKKRVAWLMSSVRVLISSLRYVWVYVIGLRMFDDGL